MVIFSRRIMIINRGHLTGAPKLLRVPSHQSHYFNFEDNPGLRSCLEVTSKKEETLLYRKSKFSPYKNDDSRDEDWIAFIPERYLGAETEVIFHFRFGALTNSQDTDGTRLKRK
jgi:hypothetical protein